MAVDPTFQSPYFGRLLTISVLNTPFNLWALVTAMDPHLSGEQNIARLYALAANTADVLVGDETLSSTNYAYALVKGTFRDYNSARVGQGIPIGRIYLLATAASSVGVELIA